MQRSVSCGAFSSEEMIEHAADDAIGQAMPDGDFASGIVERYGEETQISAFDGVATQLTEMDAVVAYLQVLGRLTDAARQLEAAEAADSGSR